MQHGDLEAQALVLSTDHVELGQTALHIPAIEPFQGGLNSAAQSILYRFTNLAVHTCFYRHTNEGS